MKLLNASLFSAYVAAEKILCLHGGGQSAESMRWTMKDFMAAMPEFEFDFAQAPDGLWMNDPPSKDDPTTDPHWADDSFEYLDDFIYNNGPYYALAGYSQGSAFIPVYLAHRGGGGSNGGGTPDIPPTQKPECFNARKDLTCSNDKDCWGYSCVDGCCDYEGNSGVCDSKDLICSSIKDCWGYPCVDGCCDYPPKTKATGSVFNRVLLMNGYVPTTHLGLCDILDEAAPLTTPAFIFSGGEDPFRFGAGPQASKFLDPIWRESPDVGHSPPPPYDPNFQRIVDFMREGLEEQNEQTTEEN